MRDYLEKTGINAKLIDEIMAFREKYTAVSSERVYRPSIEYFGREVLEAACAAILTGANLLLSGPKASGKNVLAENLSYIFGRPSYNISFHVNTDSASLVGADTFTQGEVKLRKGPVYRCAEEGGFGIFDEVNMAKNEAVAVLHATLDHRRIIDVPGYELIRLHEAARFIGTMNYGYAGTRELNEALVSRFMVLDMPSPDEEVLTKILKRTCPGINDDACRQLCGLFLDLCEKNENGEMSTKSIDLRGMISAVGMVRYGIPLRAALNMGMSGKSFDDFERDIIEDAMLTRIPEAWGEEDIFE